MLRTAVPPTQADPMRPIHLLGAVLLGAALLTGACAGAGEERTDAELADDVAGALRAADPSLSADAADCWAEVIVEEVGGDALRDLDLTSDAPPEELEEDFARAAMAARDDCDLDR